MKHLNDGVAVIVSWWCSAGAVVGTGGGAAAV